MSNVPSKSNETKDKKEETKPNTAGPHIPNSIFELLQMVVVTASLWPSISVSARTLAKLLWDESKTIDATKANIAEISTSH